MEPLVKNRCFLCAFPCLGDETICSDCLGDLPLNAEACPACARPFSTSNVCASCLQQAWAYVDSTRALFQYRYPVNHLIKHMKFKQCFSIADYLARLLAKSFFDETPLLYDCIIPVPLHTSRLISRGYNQSIELARPLAKLLGIKLDTSCCKRVRATAPQYNLSSKERRKNVRDAFSVATSVTTRQPYTHVLLVDDVITTGSTIKELARTLHKAGVSRIDAVACARAV